MHGDTAFYQGTDARARALRAELKEAQASLVNQIGSAQSSTGRNGSMGREAYSSQFNPTDGSSQDAASNGNGQSPQKGNHGAATAGAEDVRRGRPEDN